MAQLFRYLFTEDRHKSEILTFMIPSSFILDNEAEIKSRDFTSSNQKWSLGFSKHAGQMSVSLILKSAAQNMTVTADFGVTLVNREHFTRNDVFMEKNLKFTGEHPTHTRKQFVSIESLCTLDFMDERGNILCELEIRNVNTVFTHTPQIPNTPVYNRNPAELKFTSGTFMYNNYEWNICIQPRLDGVGMINSLKFYLCRLSSHDHMCRISYRYKFINGAFVHDSGIMEQYSDLNGNSNSYRFDKIKELLQLTGSFLIRLDLIKIVTIFPIKLYPFSTNKETQQIYFYDRDRQTWMMESYIEDNSFILRLFYIDINNIPNGYVRLISFNIAIRHNQNGLTYVFKKPVTKYYYKSDVDDGLEITTTIDVNEMMSENGGYLDQNGGISVEMEYIYSHLLHQPEYSHLDDISRKQKYQMLREIHTLQQENYTLEKQLHSYQQSVSNTASRTKSFDNPSASSTASSVASAATTAVASGVAGQSSINNSNASLQFSSAPSTPHVVRKYYESKYGSNLNVSNNPQDKNAQAIAAAGAAAAGTLPVPVPVPPGVVPGGPNAPNAMKNGSSKTGTGTGTTLTSNFTPNMLYTNTPSGISNITSQLTSGFANLKLSAASKIPTNKLTSKIMNPFSNNNNTTT